MLRNATLTLGAAAAVALGAPAAANAAVTFDSLTGSGFVGKGDVQLAFGWNNSTLQKNASGVSFSASQEASQALSQEATQDGTMAISQSVLREVSCVIQQKKKTFLNEGTRSGERVGTRSGTREGERSGTLAGTLASSIAYDARVKNQITGFNLKGYPTGLAFTATGSNEFGAWEFGSYEWNAPEMGATEWDGWQSDPGENPADCLGGNPGVTELSDATTYGAITEGAITDGTISAGVVSYGAVTATGAVQLFTTHNGVVKPLAITPTI